LIGKEAVMSGEMMSKSAGWWLSLKWEARLGICAAALLLLNLLLYAAGNAGWMLLLFPLNCGLLVFAARADALPSGVQRFVRWAESKREQARGGGGFLARWVRRPFYAGLCLPAHWASSLADPHLRAGTTVTGQLYLVFLSLFLAYAAVAVVIALALIAIMLMVVGHVLSGSNPLSGWNDRPRMRERSRAEEQCPDCESVAVFSIPPAGNGKCKACYGSGKSSHVLDGMNDLLTGQVSFCEVCRGTRQCQTCGGHGRVVMWG
jgi:hypothetical protein